MLTLNKISFVDTVLENWMIIPEDEINKITYNKQQKDVFKEWNKNYLTLRENEEFKRLIKRHFYRYKVFSILFIIITFSVNFYL
jgi:hypothetical protein